ncbi:MAG: flagellar hook-length control protein FliK [Thermodesulfobacteriota bacterium]
MSNIINPVLPVGGAELSVDHAKGAERSGSTFSDHLDRRLGNDQERNQDQLGVRHSENNRQAAHKGERGSKDEVKAQSDQDIEIEDQGEVATLVHFLQDIQQVAQEKNLEPGEWAVALPEPEILADLAQQAGMSEIDLTALVEKFQADNGELDLDAFLQSLINHFVSFEENPRIVVPETEIPMLEGLLTKMGLSPEQLEQVSSQVVVADGEIDLFLLAQALEDLNVATMAPVIDEGERQASPVLEENNGEQTLQAITLSPWEAEQLQGLLKQAGISLEKQLELMPEQLFGEEVVLSLERLQSLLKEAVVQAQQDQPQLDLPKFLGSLEQVMKQAAFQDQSVGFTPVVQGSLGEAYKDLLEMYDKARLRFEEGLDAEEDQLQNDIQKWLDGVVARAGDGRGSQGETGNQDDQGFFDNAGQGVGPFASGSGEEFTVHRQDGMSAPQVASNQGITQAADQPQPVRHFPAHQQQQIMNQLSLAVSRGMKSGEQNLVLRLHPAELGEVKVDLSVRNEVVSVSFTMENSKVKDTLESSMEEFRHNMEEKGFSLNEVNVFVGHSNEDQDAWQRFEMALNGEKLQAQNLEDIPDDVLYQTVGAEQYASQEEGVNLFV